jgi:hypothetical protein
LKRYQNRIAIYGPVGLAMLDLWTKWPSRVIGEVLTSNLAALLPEWVRPLGYFLLRHSHG